MNLSGLTDNHARGADGTPLESVQQLAGHSDIRMTQLYYNPLGKDAEDAARHI